jgi:hypothetical protein
MGGQVRMVVVQNRKRWLALESSPHGLLRIAVDRGRSDCSNRTIAMRARPKLHKKIGSFVRASSSAQAPGHKRALYFALRCGINQCRRVLEEL